MNSSLYPKLAVTNIKKNSKMYLPYILSCIFTIAMYYVLIDLSSNEGIKNIPGGYSIQQMLSVGVEVMSIFSIIFIFYTNSFLIKQRKKEFGLFNILGMEKRHICRVLFLETIYVSIGAIIVGLLLGMLLNKLMFLLLLKILDFEVKMGTEFSSQGFIDTIILFVKAFTVVLLNTMRQVYFSKPIELIKGVNKGERAPKNKWVLTILGVVSLGIGYYISITTTNPVQAISSFLIAVLFVCIGTYFLFIAGSITLLKILRRNKSYYYKTNHFVSVATMMYRMKQNSVGLANICILSTAVLIMLSTTVSMYIGSEDILRVRYPRNIVITSNNPSKEQVNDINRVSEEVLNTNNLVYDNIMDYRVNSMIGGLTGDKFTLYSKEDEGSKIMDSNTGIVNVILLEDYNRVLNENKVLENENDVLLYSNREEYTEDTISIGDLKFNIVENVDECIQSGIDLATIYNTTYIIVKNEEVYNKILELPNNILGSRDVYGFDLKNNNEVGVTVYNQLSEKLQGYENLVIDSSQVEKEDFYSVYGAFFFLGIFLGALFIMATILIMYYKQISEGYDDKERFNIMQKVGMSKEEIKGIVKNQVLTVFFMPLIFAFTHVAFAFPVIKRLLAMLNFVNVQLYVICTIVTMIIFGLCYGVVYIITSRVYYRIVE